MGDYATTTSISELLPQLLSGNTTTSDATTTNMFSRHIDRAEDIVTSFVGARYDVSVFIIGTTTTNLPPLMRTLTEDLACWFSIRGAYVQDGGRRQEYLDDYNSAKKMLEEIRDGKTKLMYSNGSAVPGISNRFLSSTEYAPVFNLDEDTNWEVDPDQIDDIAGDRG